LKKDGLYRKYESVIEEIADRYSHKSFLYVSSDDIKQEVRKICNDAIKSFDESKASIKTYLSKCVNNRLNNLKRDLYFRYENLCTRIRCPMYNVFIGECTSITYKEICPHNKKNNEKMQKQIGIANPVSIFSVSDEDTGSVEFEKESSIFKQEIKKILVDSAGEWIGICFDVLVKYGPSYIKTEEWNYIKDVTEEYFNG